MSAAPTPRHPEAGTGAAIRNAEGQLLLIQRLKAPEAGHWGLPGGKVDFGERAADAAIREIREELGVEIDIIGLACLTETIRSDDDRHWVAPVYHARIRSGIPTIQEPHKHGGVSWFALDALPARLTTPTRQFLTSLRPDPHSPDARSTRRKRSSAGSGAFR